jgi:uncharacterized Zn finger protein (UPF0148 family)
VRLFDAKHVGPGMSDFDREAAREELREKFERDNEKRKTTQRMSELLLKGATMTNRHCDTCGDPIFRYQGQEFCPTCQNASVDGGPDSVQDAPESATDAVADGRQDAGDASVPVEPASPDSEAATTADRQQATTGDQQQTTTGDQQQTTTGDQHPTATPNSQQATTPAEPAESPRAGTGAEEPQPAPVAGNAADLGTARASLVRTLTRYSREAESADDPRRAKELLSVAHEAAETLSALDRTR